MTAVVPTETEGVAHGGVHGALLAVLNVKFSCGSISVIVVIDGRRNDVRIGHAMIAAMPPPRLPAQQVTGHALVELMFRR